MRRRTLRLLVPVLGVCLLLGLVETVQVRFGTGDLAEDSWWVALIRVLPSWILLAALTPAVVAASERWPIRGPDWARSLAVHLALSVPFALLFLSAVAVWGSIRPESLGLGVASGFAWLVSRYLVYAMLGYGSLVGVVHAVQGRLDAEEARREARTLLEELSRARLQAAEGRLKPHFVFNTLNAITGLAVRGDPSAVVRVMDAFSDLLRATLDGPRLEPVPLEEELELLDRYLEIQAVRFGRRLRVVREVEAEALECPVPALLLQPLVENALTHAVGRDRRGGTIWIRARVEGHDLTMEVEDTGPGPRGPASTADDGPGRGIGLASTRQRLEALHGTAAGLDLMPGGSGGTVARIRLPVGRPSVREEGS